MTRRLMSLFLILTLLFTLLPLETFAANASAGEPKQKLVEESVTVELDAAAAEPAAETPTPTAKPAPKPTPEPAEPKAVVLAATEQSGDYSYTLDDAGNATITGYSGSATDLVIPSVLDSHPVTTIDWNAFEDCDSLTTVVIPDSVTSLGYRAFASCDNLTSVRISNHVAETAGGVFAECGALKTVSFSEGVTSIAGGLFHDCTGLETIVIPDTVTFIGPDAFHSCTNLKSVTIPNSVETIDWNAFEDCDSLTTVVIPDSVTSLGYRAFASCDNLTSVRISNHVTETAGGVFAECGALKTVSFSEGVTSIAGGLFHDCTGLETIVIPDTVTLIGKDAFHSCTNLKSVTIPNSVETIDWNAFEDCDRLTTVVIPDSVTSLGYRAFASCDNLTSVRISNKVTETAGGVFAECGALKTVSFSEGVTSIAGGLFHDCTGLETIVIPDTVTLIGKDAFHSCTNLKSVTIPNSVETIDWNAFEDCDRLTTVVIPDSVTSLGYGAFADCSNLKNVTIPNSVSEIDDDAFEDCDSLTLDCGDLSNAAMYAIDHNIPFAVVRPFQDSEDYVLDREGTRLFADLNAMTVNGCITLTVSYALKDSYAKKVSDMCVKLLLPANVVLMNEPIRLDGEDVDDYAEEERTLTIPVSKSSGELRLRVKLTAPGAMLGYAALTGNADDRDFTEVIGLINETPAALSMNVPGMIGTETFTVSGIAPASGTVTISVDGEEAATVTALKTGSWTAEIALPEANDYQTYTITASCPSGDETLSQTADVTYHKGEPVLTEYEMHYTEHEEYKTIDMLQADGTRPVIWFVPGTQFDFVLKYTNPEEINKLYITSTRNNEKKYLEAYYDAAKDAFVTDGFFDESDPDYVPGVIGIEYTKKIDPVYVDKNRDLSSFVSQLQTIPESAYEVIDNSANSAWARIDMGAIFKDMNGVVLDAAISYYDATTGESLSTWQGFADDAQMVASYLIPGVNNEKYIASLDFSDPYTWVMVVKDVSGSEAVKFALNTALDNPNLSPGAYSTLSTISGTLATANLVTGIVLKQHQITQDMDALRGDVMRSPYVTDKGAALQMVNDLEHDEKMFYLFAAVLPLFLTGPFAIGATMAGPAILFTGMIGMMLAMAPLFWEMREMQATGEVKVNPRALQDPSGFAFDLDTQERLQDVTVTAYWIEYDGSADFWTNVPADDEYGTLWDASEYEQANPLQTNADGKYAWDVPEGWWRVKFEKEGYDTVWSDWMTVPPIQTEVNVGMQSQPAQKTGWQKEDGYWHYYNDEGVMQTGWLKQDGKWYFLDSEGVMRKGWVKTDGKWYYMDSHGVMVTGWKKIQEQWYYFDSHGAMVTGKQTIAGKQYSFDSSGVMQTGWKKHDGKWYYFESSGAAKTGWVKSDGKWYYMDKTGAMMTGWVKVNDIWYYMDGTGAMTTGWLYKNDNWYYMDNLGHMLTGWVYLEPERYYMDEHGVMQTGWKKIDGKWYYFAANGKMAIGWQKINEKWYYFNEDGTMRTGWLKSNGKWYFMNESGTMHTGWLERNGKWYYFDSHGVMVTGTQTINGRTRTFDDNGVWLGD